MRSIRFHVELNYEYTLLYYKALLLLLTFM